MFLWRAIVRTVACVGGVLFNLPDSLMYEIEGK